MDLFRKQAGKSYSIKFRIASALFFLVVIQGIILLCCIGITDTIGKNDIATYNILSNQSHSRKNEIQNLLNTKRKNIINTSKELSDKIEKALLLNSVGIDALIPGSDIETDILDISLLELIDFTKYNAVTGVFVVFDSSQDIANEGTTYRTSMYIRDSSPGITTGNNSNLLLEYGRVDIARQRGIAVDYLWSKNMRFSPELYRDFYFKPINAIIKADSTDMALQAFGYWSAPFTLRKDDLPIISYSLPLVLSNGAVYGVIGFELDINFVSDFMPASEVPYDRGFYLLGADIGNGFSNHDMIYSGANATRFLSGSKAKIDFEFIYENEKGFVYEIINPNIPDNKAIGAYNEVGLYEKYSPFFDEKWAIICMAPKDSVMSGSNSIKSAITISIASTIGLAFMLSFFAILYIFSPIRRLSEKVKSIDPEMPVRFGKANIQEIDELTGAFEDLSDRVSEAAAKMFQIIELVNMPLGSFEINYTKGKVIVSNSLCKILNLKIPAYSEPNITIEEWYKFIGTLKEISAMQNDEGITEALYITGGEWDVTRWFRIRHITENECDLGVLIDVSDEIMHKKRIEFEQNYDSLTRLFNRRAFLIRAFEHLRLSADKVGLMMFADLDDLKFINDMHGHETGDDYLKTFARFLHRFVDLGAVAGRISGDEFVMFMGGFSSHDEAKKTFDNHFSGLKNLIITAPDNSIIKMRVSVGLSYYPDDSNDINDLVKYADYAMYEIKHKIKGEIHEFNVGSYNKNAFVINMKNILNLFIEEKKVRFAFQPIVDVRTGEIYAYESLMRSMMHELKSPDDILRIAKSQSKLYQIEKLTFSVVLNWINKNRGKIKDKKIFINTIPNQMFTSNDMTEICKKYSHLFSNVVFEITENEFSSKEDTKAKMGFFSVYGSKIAIDDYGSGYSNELSLLFLQPDFLKIDMSIVRNIDRDADKQQLVQSTIAYASKKDIKIIAEGAETYEEMEMLIHLGVDYIQGYYLARPDFEIRDISKDLKHKLVEISARKKATMSS